MDNNLEDEVTVLDQYVLVKQFMIVKKTLIRMDASKNEKDKFDFFFEVLQKGEKCERKINVGDCPIFTEFTKFQGVKILHKNEKGIIAIVIVHENDIMAIDNKPTIITEKDIIGDRVAESN